MKFTVMIDYKAGIKNGFDYMQLEAKNLIDAIAEADSLWTDSIYLMKIMQKVSKIETECFGQVKNEKYEAVLCRRSYGWHLCNADNCERATVVYKKWLTNNRNDIWYEIVS